MNKVLGDKIKSIRLNRGETLEEFGKRFNPPANRGLVSGWENGRYAPNPKRLKEIAELGNMAVEELLGNNCQLCSGQEFKASWYGEDRELEAEYSVYHEGKLITSIDMQGKYIGFIDIDINYCPECGRKLEVKQ